MCLGSKLRVGVFVEMVSRNSTSDRNRRLAQQSLKTRCVRCRSAVDVRGRRTNSDTYSCATVTQVRATYVRVHVYRDDQSAGWRQMRREDGASGREKGKSERRRGGKRSFFFSGTRGVSVKLIKFRENFYNTRPLKNVQVYTSWQFMLLHGRPPRALYPKVRSVVGGTLPRASRVVYLA